MTLKDFYALLARLFLGYIFFSSGLCKLSDGHFGQLIGPPLLIEELKKYQLGGFAIFLAFSQVMIGALILSQRWSLLGLIMLVPMNASILAATISMQWQGTPYVNGFLLILNLLVLLYEWKTLRFFLLPETTAIQLPGNTHRLFPHTSLAISVVAVALVAAIGARYSNPILMISGITVLVVAWINVWQSVQISRIAQTALAGSLLAVVSLSMATELTDLQLNVNVPLLAGIVLTLLATTITTLMIWFSTIKRTV